MGVGWVQFQYWHTDPVPSRGVLPADPRAGWVQTQTEEKAPESRPAAGCVVLQTEAPPEASSAVLSRVMLFGTDEHVIDMLVEGLLPFYWKLCVICSKELH